MRDQYKTRLILLRGQRMVEVAIAAIESAPLDASNPIEVVIREQVKTRTKSQNAAMWAGIYGDLAEQAYVNGRRYSAEVWHEHCKKEFLPDDTAPDLADLVKNPEVWQKWEFTPSGEMRIKGSTTKLTKKGMKVYLMQVEAFGAELGVHFTTAAGIYKMIGNV